MSTSYTTEPPPTASVLLQTTAGPLTLSLFAQQTPLTCRNFLQHCLDGTYNGVIFHRVAAGFVIQTGDPTGTGEGGENIYEDKEFEVFDEKWARVTGREKGERIKIGDELHSRLKFNRRGLVGMAKSEGSGASGGYGSQFFLTLGDVRAELDGKCTMFGRVEGEGIYNVVKIAEGELVEGTERPVYPEKITSVEVLEMPKGETWEAMRKRERVAKRVMEDAKKEKPKKKKAGKALLSFGGDDGDSEDVGVVVRPKKAKFNTSLVEGPIIEDPRPKTNGTESTKPKSPSPPRQREHVVSPTIPQKRKAQSPTHSKTPSPTHRRTPSFHDRTTQLPLRNEESPSNSASPTPPPQTSTSSKAKLESEIAALKKSMRRPNITSAAHTSPKKSALEALIPVTSTRGRKRPRPGDSLTSNKEDASAIKMLNAFRARLESAGTKVSPTEKPNGSSKNTGKGQGKGKGKEREIDPYSITNGSPDTASTRPANEAATEERIEEEEAQLCDLHFIANCQSCSSWSSNYPNEDLQADDTASTARNHPSDEEEDDDRNFLSHSLNFAKDRLGKDLNWRKDMRNLTQEDMETRTLAVIDVKEKEREILSRERMKWKGRGRGGPSAGR